jgi:putative peptidoglycan lipid II flippase
VARLAGGLAIVGLIEIAAIDLSTVVAIALANGRGATGAIVMFNYSSQVFSTMNAVLAGAITISVFPVLCARAGPLFDQASAGSTRAVLLVSMLGTAIIAAIAVPAAHVLAAQPGQVSQLIWGFALFAPGLAGMGLIANLTRVMFAIGRLTVAAAVLAGGWLLTIGADVVLTGLVPARLVVAALALGTTIGQTLAAIPLVVATRRICGTAAVRGAGHAALAGLAAAAAGAAAGVSVSMAVHMTHKLLAAGVAVLAAACAAIVFGVVAYILDDGDLRMALARARQLVMVRS